jgi:hypothetical protein
VEPSSQFRSQVGLKIGLAENFMARAMGRGYYGILSEDDEVPKHVRKLVQSNKDKEKMNLCFFLL